jgi:hypothetical protein
LRLLPVLAAHETGTGVAAAEERGARCLGTIAKTVLGEPGCDCFDHDRIVAGWEPDAHAPGFQRNLKANTAIAIDMWRLSAMRASTCRVIA